MSFINAGVPNEALSTLIRSSFKALVRLNLPREFAAWAFMNLELMMSNHSARCLLGCSHSFISAEPDF